MTNVEIDALIAEKLFGYEWFEQDGTRFLCSPKWYTLASGYQGSIIRGHLPRYSSDPAKSALVKAELRRQGYYIKIEIFADYTECILQYKEFSYYGKAFMEEHAVALAVLMLFGIEVAENGE